MRDYALPPGASRDEPPFQPVAHPKHYVRRVSHDGYENWVDPRSEKTTKLPVFLRKRVDKPGRLWDRERTAEPVIMGTGYRPPHVDPYAKWRDLIDSVRPPRTQESQVVSIEILNSLMPGLDVEAQPQDRYAQRTKKSTHDISWIREFVLRRPWAPLIFRILVLMSSIAALGLSAHLYHVEINKRSDQRSEEEIAQALVDMIVDAIAIPYVCYMTYDDVTGKPIGLRPPMQKVTMTLFDLFFIIFKSAGTALAFEALVYRSGQGRALDPAQARALAAMMLVSLIAWVVNFAISIFRVVESLPGKK